MEDLAVIEIINFQKHQSPHGTEKDSALPDKNGYLTVNERKGNGVVTGVKHKVHAKEASNNVKPPLEPVNPPLDNALIPDSLIPEEDQHNTLPASEPEFVDPNLPTEMTLDWVPDENLLKNYALRMALPVALFTTEAIGAFVCHYSASGRAETQAAWVSLLVKWIKRDNATASNVRQFPVKKQANGPDFFDQSWRSDTSDDL